MDVWGTIIKDSAIVGIGSLMIEQHPNEFERQFDNTRKLFFNIHLEQHSVKIESVWLKLGFGDDPGIDHKKAREEYKELCNSYQKIKNEIEQLLK